MTTTEREQLAHDVITIIWEWPMADSIHYRINLDDKILFRKDVTETSKGDFMSKALGQKIVFSPAGREKTEEVMEGLGVVIEQSSPSSSNPGKYECTIYDEVLENVMTTALDKDKHLAIQSAALQAVRALREENDETVR